MSENGKWPTPVLKCTKVGITDKCVILALAQRIGASSKLPQEFTIAIATDDIKKIVNSCVDNDTESESTIDSIIKLCGGLEEN